MSDNDDQWTHRPETRLPISLPRGMRKRLTPQEVKLWNWVRESFGPQGHSFRRQVPIGSFIVDFACLKAFLVIEVDGGQHGRPDHQTLDQARDDTLEAMGFKVLRFWNHEIDREKQVVMDTIHAALSGKGS